MAKAPADFKKYPFRMIVKGQAAYRSNWYTRYITASDLDDLRTQVRSQVERVHRRTSPGTLGGWAQIYVCIDGKYKHTYNYRVNPNNTSHHIGTWSEFKGF